MRNIFKRRTTSVTRPAQGRLVTLDEVPDPMFAARSLGDGFAVEPVDGVFASPVDGELIVVAETGHAFGVRADSGAELLVHVGIDTVALGGEGFTVLRAVGDRVAAGDPVVEVDLDVVAPRVPSMLTPVVVTNGDDFEIASTDLAATDGPVLTLAAR